MSNEQTIAAISTPVGTGGIGIIRISGPQALKLADKIIVLKKGSLASRGSHTISLAKIIDPESGQIIDEALVTSMRAPNTYTREDVVEINCHSGVPTLRLILEKVLSAGARPAEPGEFTKRAFLAGRIDLTQAQAVISLVQARTEAAARVAARQADGQVGKEIVAIRESIVRLTAELEAAIDFSDEDIEPLTKKEVSRQFKEVAGEIGSLINQAKRGRSLDAGMSAAIIGRPNVGKSSLLNAILMEEKAIVSSHPGTTRDMVEGQIQLGGVPVRLTDTAGWRDPTGEIEEQGLWRTNQALSDSDLIILVLDGSEPLQAEDKQLIDKIQKDRSWITVINKKDLKQKVELAGLPDYFNKKPTVATSAKKREGISDLGDQIAQTTGFDREPEGNEAFLASAFQENGLRTGKAKIEEAIKAEKQGFGEEVISVLAREAAVSLGEVVGEELNEQILEQIFNRFCIGK